MTLTPLSLRTFRHVKLVLSMTVSLIVTMVTLGCDHTINEKVDAPTEEWPAINPIAFTSPKFLPLADEACQQSAGTQELDASNIHYWDGEDVVTNQVPIPGLTSKKSAATKSVLETQIQYHEQEWIRCDSPNDPSCSKYRVVKQPQPLKLCTSSPDYPRETLESATLTSLAAIENSSQYYAALQGSKNLRQVSLLMMPNFEEIIEKRLPDGEKQYFSTVKTDNAAFALAGQTTAAQAYIIVYPKSHEIESRPEWQDINLWEVPWIMSHEFGHYIFSQHYAYYRQDALATNNENGTAREWNLTVGNPVWSGPQFETGDGDFRDDNGGGFALQSNRNVKQFVLGSLNEGFADLFGTYVNGDKDDVTDNLPCFRASRNLHRGSFSDRKRKALDDDALKTILSTGPKIVSTSCTETNLHDSHHVGAIFAYGLNRIFAETMDQGAQNTALAKANMAISWLNKLNTMRRNASQPSAQQIMELAINAAVETATSRDGAQRACGIAEEVFPALSIRCD